jgi:hypothetical protein
VTAPGHLSLDEVQQAREDARQAARDAAEAIHQADVAGLAGGGR